MTVREGAKRVLEVAHLLPAAEACRTRLGAYRPSVVRAGRDDLAMRVALATTLKPDSHCIDVGAHTGTVLTEMIRLAPLGRHVAFEPLPHLAAGLRATFPGVDVREVALSDRAGRTTFTHVRSNPAYSGFRRRSYPGAEDVEEIEVVTGALDDCLPSDLCPAVIKIDVEGAEAEVLRGAMRTMSTHRPLVLFEHGVGGADHYGTTSTEVYGLLGGCGLRIFDSEGMGPYSEADFCASFTAPMWNWMAV